MEQIFELRGRLSVKQKETPFGMLTVVMYTDGVVYLGLPTGDKRFALVLSDEKSPFYGSAKTIDPFGSEGIEQPHLRLTVVGEPLFSYN